MVKLRRAVFLDRDGFSMRAWCATASLTRRALAEFELLPGMPTRSPSCAQRPPNIVVTNHPTFPKGEARDVRQSTRTC